MSAAAFKLLSETVETLQNRVHTLEARVSAAADASSQPASPIQTQTRRGSGGATASPPPSSAAYAGTSRRYVADDEMIFELEDLHQQNRINTMRNLNSPQDNTLPLHLGRSAGGAMSTDIAVAPRVNFLGDTHPLSFLLPTGTDYIAAALATLPQQHQCELLVKQYGDSVEWFQRCLHYPTFMAQCRQFWDNTTTTHNLSPDFVCTYVMVVCLGLRMMVPGSPGEAEALALAERLFHVAEGVLWCSRFLQRQTFESLQAISLMTVYGFGMEDGADATWALYGSAIKIGQNLGLNRLEEEASDKTWAPLWSSRLQREIGRRVWWTFVCLDWSHAVAHGSSCE